ncbi:unnamed protein product [Lupinus luteus]|uniref:Uncharacterized protein n=1 Tax=Lupinus luteus TaxID=3873 RepID=A0AAV1W0I3_LUPLU
MLRLFRLCSFPVRYNNVSILGESYKVHNKVTSIRSLCTTTDSVNVVDSRENQIVENQCHVSYQNIVVIRHGDRIDNSEPSWLSTASQPWDPPLAQVGRVRAFQTGQKIRNSIGFPIHRVFVSPFLRCVQTASEIVAALSAVGESSGAVTGDQVVVDPAKVKVSVEYGLCEMMNRQAIRLDVVPNDGNWDLDASEREAMLPAEAVDTYVERVYKELPQWEEPVLQTRARFQRIFKDLANKYPSENLLLITHGEGVEVALSSFKKNAKVYELQYCAYVELKRPVFKKHGSFTTGEFHVVTNSGETGISYFLPKCIGS